MTRARAEEMAAAQPPAEVALHLPRPSRARQEALAAMGTDVKLLLATGALVLVAGLGWLVFGPQRAPVPAVLGYVDAGPPPAPRPTPPPRPPFKLPWWK
jgi:hypothetical protein